MYRAGAGGLALLLALVALPAMAQEAAPRTLDELLEVVKQARVAESRENRAREQRFLRERNERSRLLKQARAELKAEQQRSERLKAAFDANEKKLAELEETLRQRMGSLGELFGVVRQVAGDARATFDNSVVSSQIQGRQAIVEPLARSKELPSIAQLEDLWYVLQQEMTESGKVVTYPARVISADGAEGRRDVTRVGTFTVVSGDRFLRFLGETGELLELPRQPARRYRNLAAEFQQASGGLAPMVVDPSRGSILALLVQAPDLKERVQQGKLVGYVIIAIAVLGLLVVAERYLGLSITWMRIRRQLRSEEPKPNNPLGRILMVYHQNQDMDPETLELRIDEAILHEVPKVQRGLATVKILAVIAPLLGLLGTVTGMIETFQSITLFGTGDPKLMAGGISQALVTTVLGLVTAIPMVLLHSVLAGKSKRIVSVLDEQSAGIIAAHAERDRGHAAAD